MNNMNTQRIIWMMDETIANTHPQNWDRVRELENELVRSVGKSNAQHEVVDPLICLKEMVFKIQHERFSSIIDLTGWLKPTMIEVFPYARVEDGFGLSRVRSVSSADLETTGYVLNKSLSEIKQSRETMDLSRVLILDDVSFTGYTSSITMELWELDPENTAHAFLIANRGRLGFSDQSPPGAVPMLESLGCQVFSGKEIHTPEDDGWHLKDLHQHTRLTEAFAISCLFQAAFMSQGAGSDIVKKALANNEIRKILFPDSLSSTELENLKTEGKFIGKNNISLSKELVHARNPLLWASPYFGLHIDHDMLNANSSTIVRLLEELRSLTNDPEAKKEASKELQQWVRECKNKSSEEGRLINGKERG